MPASQTAGTSGVVRFEDCVVDLDRRELRRGGVLVHVQPKSFDVLCYFLAAGDRLVSKDELLDSLWPNEVVAETSLTFAVKAVRRAIGDDGEAQRMLRTVHGRGYRFVAALGQAGEAAPRAVAPARDRILLQPVAATFVGRQDESAVLDAEYEAASEGAVRAVLLLGDPGVGKSRLAAEFAGRAEARGALVLVGRCDDGGAPALWPWSQVLRAFVEIRGVDEARAACGEAVRDLGRLLPGLAVEDGAAWGEPDPDHARIRLLDGLSVFLREAARERPVVVVLDDLHWADASSLLALRHLTRELLDARLLLVGTYRHQEVEPGTPLADLLGWLQRTRRSTRVRLVGLDDEDVAVMVRELSGVEPGNELVAEVGRATGGNPFFVEEWCRDAGETGSVPSAGRMPEQVRDLLLQRLWRLDAATPAILSLGAVIGREFPYALLAPASGAPEAEVRRALVEAERAGLLHADTQGSGRFAFAHALVAEALRTSLGPVELADAHARVAAAIEGARSDDEAARLTSLAHHRWESRAVGDRAAVFRAQVRAGHALAQRYAYEDAAAHFDRALELTGESAAGDDETYEVLLALARASAHCGQETRSRALLHEAAAIARRLGSTAMLARAALGNATLFPMTPGDAVSLLEEALGALRSDAGADRGLLASVLAALASGLYARPGELDRREELVEEAMELARTVGDERTVLRVVSAGHVALWRPGHLARRFALATEHLAMAEGLGHRLEAAGARAWLVAALVEMGRVAEADVQVDLLEADVGSTRSMAFRANPLAFRAMRALTRGEFDQVEFLARRAYDITRRFNETAASMTLWSHLYYLRREQGRLSEIEAGVQLFASQVVHVPWDWLLVHLQVEDGRGDAARAAFEVLAAEDFARGLPPHSHIVWSSALFGMVEVAWRLGHAAAAASLLGRVEKLGSQWVTVGLCGVCLGSSAYARGLALATLGRDVEAEQALAEADAAHSAAGMPALATRARAERAVVLLGRRDRASRRLGRDLASSARAEAETVGQLQVLALLDEAGA